jgi:NFU1 iron-sulfur cluster scaffold homolog, mitochondrial
VGYQVTEFQDTPNPNALKCVLDRPLPPFDGLRSYQLPPEPGRDPLAAALFNIPDVVGVFLNPGWVTISKSPDAQWKNIKVGVKKVLSDAD